jgi:ATP-dependent DNA helicase RecQ
LLYNNHIEDGGIEEDLKLPLSFIENSRPAISDYKKVIKALKDANAPLSESEIMRKTNLRQQQVRVIKSDLLDQKIVVESVENRRKVLEYRFDAPEINTKPFDALIEHKKAELYHFKEYIKTSSSRMNFLCSYLGDMHDENIRNCDNTNLPELKYTETEYIEKHLTDFWDNFFPIISMAPETTLNNSKYILSSPFWSYYELKIDNVLVGRFDDPNKFLSIVTVEDRENVELRLINKHLDKARITDVVATSYYSYPKVGTAIRSSKYQNGGDFPFFLVERMKRAFEMNLVNLNLELILFVPPTESGKLVENLSRKLGELINIPILNLIKKSKNTEPQKIFENIYLKTDNVRGAFELIDSNLVSGKRILLIDDVIDSGATIKEVCKLLHDSGAELIAPMVLAKTIGGDQL